jgi:multidrug efflux pump subunit AcrA (membrane-fusion protein)
MKPFLVAMLVSVVVLGSSGTPAHAQTGPTEGKKPAPPLLMERFDALTPAARWQLVDKATKSTKDFQPAVLGDVIVTVVERGSLEPVQAADITCAVRSRSKGSNVATAITWLVENGSVVKKGDVVVKLDASGLQEMLKDKIMDVKHAFAAKERAVQEIKMQRIDCETDIEQAKINLQKAKTDGDKIRVTEAEGVLKRVKAQAEYKSTFLELDRDVKQMLYELERARQNDLEDEIANSTIKAPLPGLVLYYVSPPAKGGKPPEVIAPGEPVHEGQKLLQICDLSRMRVRCLVHESVIASLQIDQQATVRIDAFPEQTFSARVRAIGHVALPLDQLANDVKVFPVQLILAGEPKGLKPGMSATADIEVNRSSKVVRVPVQSVVRVGKEFYCYVKSGQEIDKRQVKLGLRNDLVVEIKAGVQPGDLVLLDLRGMLRRLSTLLNPAANPEQKSTAAPTAIHVRSVLSVEVALGSKERQLLDYGLTFRDLDYGLTLRDLQRIAALPTASQIVALRRLTRQVWSGHRHLEAQVVGCTPGLVDLWSFQPVVGRWLTVYDEEYQKNVAVLGTAVAEALFPLAEAVGQTIAIGRQPFVVVGVMQAPPGHGDMEYAIYLPLSTCQKRFGARVLAQRAGHRVTERVQLSDIYVIVADALELAVTEEGIRSLLQEHHWQNDWETLKATVP